MLAFCSSLIDNSYPCLPTGPLRISCLCSCHSSCFKRAHHTSSPANVEMGLNDRLSPVSANETRELIRSGVVKIAPPQQNTWHFSVSAFVFSITFGFQTTVIHKSFSVKVFHNAHAMQLYAMRIERSHTEEVEMTRCFSVS